MLNPSSRLERHSPTPMSPPEDCQRKDYTYETEKSCLRQFTCTNQLYQKPPFLWLSASRARDSGCSLGKEIGGLQTAHLLVREESIACEALLAQILTEITIEAFYIYSTQPVEDSSLSA